MIRITAGTLKNRALRVPEGISRPLTDRIRTSIFGILNPYCPNSKVLDLYAGSGVTGMEALSRGAVHCTFVDLSHEACDIIKSNLNQPEIEDSKYQVVNKPVVKYLKDSHDIFDIIFIDPPFDQTFRIDLKPLLDHVNNDSIIVLRTSSAFYRKHQSKFTTDGFEEKYSKNFGESEVVFYRVK